MTNTKNNPFKSISENLPFWPDKTNEHPTPEDNIFTGVLVDESRILGEDPDPQKNTPVFVFAEIETGEKFFIVQSYAVKKAVEKVQAAGENLDQIVFRFEFKGKSESKGKPFNQFDTAYCSLQEYQMIHSEVPDESGKGKKK